MLPGLVPFLIPPAGGLRPQDVFAASLFSGSSSTQTVTTGVNLAGNGGLVWAKRRNGSSVHELVDTVRGSTSVIYSNLTEAAGSSSDIASITTTGFTLGNGSGNLNTSGMTGVAWSFRRAAKFFDVVTWTGDGGENRLLNHNLGVVPGFMVIKRLDDGTASWFTVARTSSGSYVLSDGNVANFGLNLTNAAAGTATLSQLGATATQFYPARFRLNGTEWDNIGNISGGTHVAYLFAHDTAADGIVQCGSYTGNGSATGPTISLGWRPQYLLVKNATSAADWYIWDAARDASNPRSVIIFAGSSAAEVNSATVDMDFTTTGFQPKASSGAHNTSGATYVYLAIREPI